MSNAASSVMRWTEMGLVPDTAIRAGIRRLLVKRLKDIQAGDAATCADTLNQFVADMCVSRVAPVPELANEQHYEVPAEFFSEVLGKHHKYSSCYWQDGTESLDQAEADALSITCERAGIENGMDVLDLGCGWGSLSLWMAENFPDSRITSVSNSSGQRRYIEKQAQRRKLENLQVITCDMNDFDAPGTYDRIVSVEMFEHMRNYRELFRRVNSWLRPGGYFFMHIFCHRHCAYAFEDNGPDDWMSRFFFSGGIMPSADLPLRFQDDLKIRKRWVWDGRHYEKTSNAWLRNMDMQKEKILPILAKTYGDSDAPKWFMRWRMFFMACAELFAYADGQEWFVGHYLFERGAGVE
jgi:cyclopropane-fatty-acyl-phospholipid synthase